MNKYSSLFSSGGLSLERLQTLVGIVDAGGLSRAAQADPSRMSLFSRQVKELEGHFGLKLTERRGRSLVLNGHGLRLVRLAREALDGLAGFAAACRDEPGELCIGAGNSVLEWWLMPRLPTLKAALPRTCFRLLNLRTDEAIRQVQDMALDLAVVRINALKPGLSSKPLLKVAYRLYVPAALADGLTARSLMSRLATLPLATSAGGEFRAQLEAMTDKAGQPLSIAYSCSSFTQAARAVSEGFAAAILPDLAAVDLKEPQVVSYALPALATYSRELSLAWHPRRLETNQSMSVLLKLLQA